MALPKLESFTDTDGTSLSAHNASWVHARTTSFTDPTILAGALRSATTGAGAVCAWVGDSFNNNQYAQATANGVTVTYAGPCVRLASGVNQGYLVDSMNGDRELLATPGTWTALFTDAGALALNDLQRIEASGSTIVYKLNGTTLASVTDTTWTSGSAGLITEVAAAGPILMDSWEGGNLSGGGASFPITRSVTQAQTLALVKQPRLTRTDTQPQTLALVTQPRLIRLLTQAQSLTLRRAITLTRVLTQAQSLAIATQRVFLRTVTATVGQAVTLVKQARLTVTTTESIAISPMRLALARTVSVTQATAAALVKQVRLTRSLTQAQSLAISSQRVFLATVTAAVGQAVSLRRAVSLTKSTTQAQVAISLRVAVTRTLLVTQSSAAASVRAVRLTRALAQPTAASLTISLGTHVYTITVSTTVHPLVSLVIQHAGASARVFRVQARRLVFSQSGRDTRFTVRSR